MDMLRFQKIATLGGIEGRSIERAELGRTHSPGFDPP